MVHVQARSVWNRYRARFDYASPYSVSQYTNHFSVLDVKSIGSIADYNLPVRYDFVFWNFIGRWDITKPDWQAVVRHVQSLAMRRLILGFYGANDHIAGSKEWREERDRLLQVSTRFEDAGFKFSGYRLNPTEYNQVIGWIDCG